MEKGVFPRVNISRPPPTVRLTDCDFTLCTTVHFIHLIAVLRWLLNFEETVKKKEKDIKRKERKLDGWMDG